MRVVASSNLVVLNGDVNYRRLLSDRRWDPDWRVNGERGMIRVVECAAGGPSR